MSMRFRTIVLTCVFFFLSFSEANAQRTGNIVEYFGKERAENSEEGIILHEFIQGLTLRGAIHSGTLTGGKNIVAWQLATDRFQRPQAGQKLQDSFRNDPANLVWEAIEADSANVFSGNLHRAWLYVELESPEELNVLLDASGHTRVFINGLPREGDHYDYAYTLIPFTLKKGINQFLFTCGRFARVSAKIVMPSIEVFFSTRDMTLPALIRNERHNKWGAIRVVNSGNQTLQDYTITCRLRSGETVTTTMDNIISMTTRKVKFQVPAPRRYTRAEKIAATLILKDATGKEVSRAEIKMNQQNINSFHERTFVSDIDGSVQYFSVAPSTCKHPGQALVLSLHGASVEATGQARAYKQKDWAHIVAPTNRRPFGFNWGDWGRMDALEVLHQARKLFHTDTSRTYLTGHSMGGHGSWFIGATYPDLFAAIAPAAAYPDLIDYIRYLRPNPDSTVNDNPHFEMIYRGAMPGRTLNLVRNYLQSGVYVLHGGIDKVVPVKKARLMRSKLGEFHNNFAYYEYPGGSHWYGNHSMDWPPLFDFLRQNTTPATKDVKHIEFRTASPAVSATNYWVRINQQQRHYELSTINLQRSNDTISGKLQNVQNITLLLSKLEFSEEPVIIIDGQEIKTEKGKDITLKLEKTKWVDAGAPNRMEKHPDRYGGFKLAFDNNMVFVYATNGTVEENQWYMNKARFDAETFLYRGNGSIDIVADTDFSPEKFAERNVILYGNTSNNKAWDMLLGHAPIRVENGMITFGNYSIRGNDLGSYFIYPRADSENASIGVVAGTGTQGMKSLALNDYFLNRTGFPDLLVFSVEWLKNGAEEIKVSGFFGNDWSIENGDFRMN